MTPDEETERATTQLRGKTVKRVVRNREGEVLGEFHDGSRLYADSATALELSIELPHEVPD